MDDASGRWNSFQRTMFQWNDLHPYNAVHVLRIPGALDLPRLQSAVNSVVQGRGLTGLVMDRARGSYRYEGGPLRGEIKLLVPENGGLEPLAREIEAQLNNAFDVTAPGEPFRFFALTEAAAFWFALVYFHPVADADSIVRLMNDIETVYRNPAAVAGIKPWNRNPRRHDWLMLRHPILLFRWLAALPAAIRSARSSCRPNDRDPADRRNGFRLFSIASGAVPRLTIVARSWGVTLNDLFLAAVLLAVSPLAESRRKAARRRQFSVATIVNIRKDAGDNRPNTYGLALGSFRVAHEVPQGITLAELARAVRYQTARVKRGKFFLGTPIILTFARLFFARLSPERQRKFYQKNHPLWAGITNLNLGGIWNSADGSPPPDYFRAVSTGPATPLVFSITTAGERLYAGMSFRTTVFLNSEVERVQDDFQQLLELADHSQ